MNVLAAEHRRSCDLRALLVKQANVRKQKCFAVWRDATERKQALEVEQVSYNYNVNLFSDKPLD